MNLNPLLLLLLVLLAAFLLYKAFKKPAHRKILTPDGIEIDKTDFPVTGIDVSKHTGVVDFKKLKADKIDFVYIKATEGISLVDRKFNRNYRKAKENKFPVGVYHFFRFNKSGKKQALNFLNTIAGLKMELPLVLDIEDWKNARNIGRDEIVKEIGSFLREVKAYRNGTVMLYTNESGYENYIEGNFDDNPIWICSFNDPPEISADWVLWQHSHRGRLPGAEGWLDINTFNGSREAWQEYLADQTQDQAN